jgi:nucleotide-binding universal stress UspA family protein
MTVFERIVVGVDGRAGGRDALALAAMLQGVCGGDVTAVNAYPCDRTVSLDRADVVEATREHDLLARLENELARAGVTARALVVADPSPAHALQAIAERDGADLIVVGAMHRAGADRLLGGDDAAST